MDDEEDRLLAAVRDSRQLTVAAQAVIRENLDLRAERDRLRVAVEAARQINCLEPKRVDDVDDLTDAPLSVCDNCDERWPCSGERLRTALAQLDGSEVMGGEDVVPPDDAIDGWHPTLDPPDSYLGVRQPDSPITVMDDTTHRPIEG